MTRRRKGRSTKSLYRSQPRPYQQEAEMVSVAVNARQRVYGLSRADSEPNVREAESAIGRLYLSGELGPTRRGEITRADELLETAREFERAYREFGRAIQAKRVTSAGNLDRVGGFDGDDGSDPRYIARCDTAIRRYQDMRRAVLEVSQIALMAVESWIIEDRPIWNLKGDLLLGLNALARRMCG